MFTLRQCVRIIPQVFPLATRRAQSAPALSFRGLAGVARKTAEGKVNCACAGHPWPVEEVKIKVEAKKKDCAFDFKKLEVNPYDAPCDCVEPPPAAGCKDLGRPKNVCCHTIRQFGCYCEEEVEKEDEESCEEEGEEEGVVQKTCDLDFRKLEVNPYDDSCECVDDPPPNKCDSLGKKAKVCRTPKPFGCACDAYDEPGLDCFKPKGTKEKVKTESKECNKKEYKAKCL